MRKNHHYATILVGLVVAAVLVFVIWHGGSSKAQSDDSPIDTVISHNVTVSSVPTESNIPTPSASPSPFSDSDELVARSIKLVEQYFLLEPTDTPQTRKVRLEQLQVPADVIVGLDLSTGTLSCSDKTRLNPTNPLVQRAVVANDSVERTEYQDDAGKTVVYLVVPIQLALYNADDTPYSDSSTCITSSLWTVGLTWVQTAEGIWSLTSLVSPEGGSL